MEITKILVPVDFSENSQKAVEWALLLGEYFKADITLIHVLLFYQEDVGKSNRMEAFEQLVKEKEQEIHRQLEEQSRIVKQENLNINSVLMRGISPADTLLEFVHEKNFDLVVMGTHGKTGLRHFVQGSVAEKMVRNSPVPVLTIHRTVENNAIHRILVPVDFSIYSTEALMWANEIAVRYQAKLVLLHVIEREVYPSFYTEEAELPPVDENLHSLAREQLREFVSDFVDESAIEEIVVREGPAHKEIVDFVKEKDIDLLVIATHGLTGLEYLLMGSTAEKVIRWATCPVLTVKRTTRFQ
ncbi:MAG: universal stress protein [Calditrichaeota bacterium]|nr:MAG: universal stress protein [Calditrichota bacterium]